jgi:hypothetical protein
MKQQIETGLVFRKFNVFCRSWRLGGEKGLVL